MRSNRGLPPWKATCERDRERMIQWSIAEMLALDNERQHDDVPQSAWEIYRPPPVICASELRRNSPAATATSPHCARSTPKSRSSSTSPSACAGSGDHT